MNTMETIEINEESNLYDDFIPLKKQNLSSGFYSSIEFPQKFESTPLEDADSIDSKTHGVLALSPNLCWSSDNELMEEIRKIQDIQKSHSLSFFKRTDKMNSARMVSSQFNLNQLIESTIFIIPNTNKIYFNYLVFKTYANPENYIYFIEYLLYLFDYVIQMCGTFELHVNIQTFTISAAQRYKEIIELFCTKCLVSNTNYSHVIDKMYIYFPPNVMENIIKIISPLVDKNIRSKVVIHKKEESDAYIKSLFASF